ncbi:MAG: rod shape-determining protein MreC [Bradymonadales bacterium]|jgi:rod shape-determining protein MreC
MKENLKRYRNLLLVIVGVSLPLLLLSVQGGQRATVSVPERTNMFLAATAQNHFDYLVGNSAGFWNAYIDLVHTKADNEALRLENARLREENTGLQGILQENARLNKLVGFRNARAIFELAPARVIAADVSPYFRVLRIRVEAERNDIKPEMPVVSAEGLVGRVERVNGRFCDIMLAVDPRSKIDILTQVNRSRGILSGLGDDRSYDAKISYLLRRDEVEEGELVVTSGRAGSFPKELPVGRVRKVNSKEFGLYQSATVEPIVDFSRLEELYIIIGEIKGEPHADSRI